MPKIKITIETEGDAPQVQEASAQISSALALFFCHRTRMQDLTGGLDRTVLLLNTNEPPKPVERRVSQLDQSGVLVLPTDIQIELTTILNPEAPVFSMHVHKESDGYISAKAA